MRRMHRYGPGTSETDSRFLSYVSGKGMIWFSCDVCVYHLGLFVFFPGVFLSSRVTGACPLTTDLMRVYVRTTTTTTTTTTNKQKIEFVHLGGNRVCALGRGYHRGQRP